jgi:hypothetical protein
MKNSVTIVAGGPSLIKFDWSVLEGRTVITINNAAFKLPTASIVYFTDQDWLQRWEGRLQEHDGQKIKGSLPGEFVNLPWIDEWKFTSEIGLATEPKTLAHGRNSGYAAINLAVQLGYNDIHLLGYDMHNVGSQTNFHTDHTRTTADNTYLDFLERFQTLVEPLNQLGVNVWNCNPNSALKAFPHRDFN